MKLRELLNQLQVVQKKIGASEPFICGGTPRDRYLGHLENISDLDITTGDKSVDYLSQEFAITLRKEFNVTRKSMDDGHSTLFIGNLKMDFSSNFNVTKRFTIDVRANYVIDKAKNRPILADGAGNANFQVMFLPTSLNVNTLKPGTKANGDELLIRSERYC